MNYCWVYLLQRHNKKRKISGNQIDTLINTKKKQLKIKKGLIIGKLTIPEAQTPLCSSSSFSAAPYERNEISLRQEPFTTSILAPFTLSSLSLLM